MRRFGFVWGPCVLAMLVIAAESSDFFSAGHTSHWLRPLFKSLSERLWWELHHMLRKSGHFLGYGCVGLTFLRAWRLEGFAWTWARAVLCTCSVASLDEWHQSFIPSRQGSVWDVLLDTCGAGVLCGAAWWMTRRERNAYSAMPESNSA